MTHVRKQIRDKVETLLTGLSTTGSRVYSTRLYRTETANLPCLLIYTKSEPVSVDSLHPRRYERQLELVVDGIASATSNLDDTLDAIGLEVEEALAANQSLDGLAKDTVFTGSEIEFNAEGQQPVGTIRLTFNVFYRTAATDVETAL